jgi:hypothetical protein
MKTEFSTLDIVRRLGIPRGRLREWINEGFIEPSIQKSKGHGSKSLFSRLDVYAIVYYKHLIEKLHLPRSEAAKVINVWLNDIGLLRDLEEFKEEDVLNGLNELSFAVIWLHDEKYCVPEFSEIFRYMTKGALSKRSFIEGQMRYLQDIIAERVTADGIFIIPFKLISAEARKVFE